MSHLTCDACGENYHADNMYYQYCKNKHTVCHDCAGDPEQNKCPVCDEGGTELEQLIEENKALKKQIKELKKQLKGK
jgi:hypothetical protein